MFVQLIIANLVFVAISAHNFRPDGTPVQFHAFNEIDPDPVPVWPRPQQVNIMDTYMTIDPKHFTFVKKIKGKKCELLDKAVERYKKLAFLKDCSRLGNNNSATNHHDNDLDESIDERERPGAVGQLKNITIQLGSPCEAFPVSGMNEMYLLRVNHENNQRAYVFAESVWGALRALETFSQLVVASGGGFRINTTAILDFPRFSHRGVMLDTSRHFVSKDVLMKNLDAMAWNKFNVFHWHIVDDQSFPFVSTRFANLSRQGAYNPKTHVYSPADVAMVIEFGRQRGIRVVPEFDSPGHTQSWGKGQEGLLTTCYSGTRPNGQFGPIDPSKESSFEFIQELFGEVAEVFPDRYLHLGGDEVDFGCWKSNPEVQEFMKKKRMGGDFAKLEEYYVQNVLDIVEALNKSYLVWQEVFDNGVDLKPDTVVHVWKDGWKREMAAVTKKGFSALLSSCWYLNVISYGTDWPQYYLCDPQSFNGTEKQNKLVLGGEACMWAEWVDGTNLISTTWPRASAVAERLWSAQNVNSPDVARDRFELQRCRMMQRGLQVAPNGGPGYCPCDYAVK